METAALIGAGFRPVSLGPRTLRLETAAVALVCSIQLLWGDMGTDARQEFDGCRIGFGLNEARGYLR